MSTVKLNTRIAFLLLNARNVTVSNQNFLIHFGFVVSFNWFFSLFKYVIHLWTFTSERRSLSFLLQVVHSLPHILMHWPIDTWIQKNKCVLSHILRTHIYPLPTLETKIHCGILHIDGQNENTAINRFGDNLRGWINIYNIDGIQLFWVWIILNSIVGQSADANHFELCNVNRFRIHWIGELNIAKVLERKFLNSNWIKIGNQAKQSANP